MDTIRRVLFAAVAVCVAWSSPVRAEHGASDERVSLPDGPGSIGGVGDNVDVDMNMGSMTYSVGIEVPQGFPTATPSLSMMYSSASGSGELGVGWSMGVSSIERMRLRGLPEFTEADEFAVNGGSELVRVSASMSSAVYRARSERGFVRYQWRSRGDGSAGYWTGERPDGTVDYYGADEAGNPVRTARVQTPAAAGRGGSAPAPAGAVYRYMLTTSVDIWGHAIRYSYIKDGESSLLDTVSYVDTAGGPRFTVRFGYENRPDAIVTGEPGFVLSLTKRLSEVQVRSGTEVLRRYLLTYEPAATSGGVSRLAGVEQRGRGDAPTPVRFTFGYSRSLDGASCAGCEGPYVVDMGALPTGVNLLNGTATLLDIDGDALPDILDTSLAHGRHRFIPTRMDAATGRPSFGTPRDSTVTPADTGFRLGGSTPGVQPLDVNGDGFTDLISSRLGQVLCNDGSGDWNGRACLMNSALPDFGSDGDSDPLGVRFLDYDDDKRIDLLRTVAADSAQVWVNTGSAFVSRDVQPLGAMFDADPSLQLADMNGDGLQDAVAFSSDASQVRVRTSLGFGRWTDWQSISVSGFSASVLEQLELQDINGDGLSDVVLVGDTTVTYVVNRGGGRFAPPATLTSADVEGDLPLRDLTRSLVLFADMNGSGSSDIVWITDGRVQFLELFPVRPNLLSRVENGLGAVHEVTYGTSVLQQARDTAAGRPWAYKLPNAMNVLVAQDTWNRLYATETTGLHETSELVYRDGYYDGVNRAFRGFGHVERVETGDLETDGQMGSLSVYDFDLGITESERHGLTLRMARLGGAPGAWTPMLEERTTWASCPLAEATSTTSVPVVWICETQKDSVIQEGAPESEWRTVRTEKAYDRYGGMTLATSHGVVNLGPPERPAACGVCAAGSGPCGATCTGDEQYVESTTMAPGTATGGRWILGAVQSRRTYGEPGGPATEERVYYDGPAFEGLASGTLTRGAITRVEQRLDDTTWLQAQRVSYDANGNVVQEIRPNGSVGVDDDERTVMTYDELGIRIARVDRLFRDRADAPVALRREYLYEPFFYEVSESTSWMLVRGGSAVTPRNSERYRYDAFGRPTSILRAGDNDATPSAQYTYDLGSPVSRIVTRSRTVVGGALDTEAVSCVDGLGREVQTRTRLSDGSYQVSGFNILNRRGSPVRTYDAFVSSSGACDMTAPSDVPYETQAYDAMERPVTTTDATERVYGTRSMMRVQYGPMTTTRFDAEDTEAGSAYANTPLVETSDGLGRVVSMVRDLGAGVTERTTLDYDSLGRLVRVTAPDGTEHTQSFDLLGRMLTAADPDRGMMRFVHDPEGRVLERTDGRGQRVAMAYDGLGRPVSQWDPTAEAATRTETFYDEDPGCASCTNGAGRMVSTSYPLGELGTGRDELGRDARGNLVLQARTLNGHRFETRQAFDALGQVTRTEFPGGIAFDHTYDLGGRLSQVSGIVDDLGYDAQGRLSTLFYANGVRTERGYDDAGRLEAVETIGGPRVLQGVSIARDRAGNVTGLMDTSEPEAPRPSLSGQFTYDAGYRLRRASLGEAGATEETLEFTYGAGDRTSSIVSSLGAASRAHVASIIYDAMHPNAVARADDLEFQYDASGRMTRRGLTSLGYDYLGRLETVTGEGGEQTGRFFYGGGVSRVARIENGSVTYYIGHDAAVRDGIVTVHPRVGTLRAARVRTASIQADVLTDTAPLAAGDGEINAADAWVSLATTAGIVDGLPDASDAMWLLSGAARRLLTLDGGEKAFLHQDHLGSTTLSTGTDGQVLGETLFYPTGEVRHHSGYVDEYGFSSQELDGSTGLLGYNYRQLDPGIGRWTSPDPLFDGLSASSTARLGESTTGYAYVANHYGNATDPTGLAGEQAGTAAGARPRSVSAEAREQGAARGRAFVQSVRRIAAAPARIFGPKKWAVIKFGLKVAIGFLLGGPAGVAVVLVAHVAGIVINKAVTTFLTRTAVGRRIGASVANAWNRMDKSTAGQVLRATLIVGVVGGIIAGLVFGADVTGVLEIPALVGTAPFGLAAAPLGASSAGGSAGLIAMSLVRNVAMPALPELDIGEPEGTPEGTRDRAVSDSDDDSDSDDG